MLVYLMVRMLCCKIEQVNCFLNLTLTIDSLFPHRKLKPSLEAFEPNQTPDTDAMPLNG